MSSSSFHNIDVVCFSLSRWDAPISSPAVSIAKELSKSHRVFFIDHPYSFRDYLRERKSARSYREDAVTIITPPLVYPVNFLPEGKLYHFFSAVNNSILLKTLKDVLLTNNINRYIFINFFDPFFLQKISGILPEKYIYQCMDDISQVAYTARHGLRLEKEIISRADYTLCTSRELTKLKSPLSAGVRFHPNAADTGLFNQAFRQTLARPADLDFPDRKIIGFTGSIEYRTDFALLNAVAEYHHDKIIYLIGPVAGQEHISSGLKQKKNVIFAGPRHIHRLPPYVQHFDCAIIPYKKNTLTSSIYPLKINEYLAAGKPVVATDFSEDMRSFREQAYIAQSSDDFVKAIDTAIGEDDDEKKQQRVNAAALNSWTRRVEEFWNIISGASQ